MKSTGNVRKVDKLGRIVLPIKVRKKLDIKEHDLIEIFTVKEGIAIRKYNESCVFCDSEKNLKVFKNQPVCEKCFKKISENF